MTVMASANTYRDLILGARVSKATGTLTAATIALFTIAGGKVMVTQMVGEVTTAVSVANATFKLQHNPTLATAPTSDLFAATDIGTTDTPVGSLLGFSGVKTATLIGPGVAPTGGASEVQGLQAPIIMTTGQIEQISGGTDGAITWVLTYVALDTGATIVAA